MFVVSNVQSLYLDAAEFLCFGIILKVEERYSLIISQVEIHQSGHVLYLETPVSLCTYSRLFFFGTAFQIRGLEMWLK